MQLPVLLLSIFFAPTFQELTATWKNYKEIYRKSYTAFEEPHRFQIFQSNVRKIEKHNKKYENSEVSFKMGVNQFADMTREEFSSYFSGAKFGATNATRSSFGDAPDEIDWREQGAVTEVKNQGVCGACWAFSVTGALEAQNFLKTGKLVSLSEQELVDCIIERTVRGCNGGFVDDAFRYVMKNGLSSEDAYPYQAQDGLCHRGSIPSSVTEIGFSTIFGDEEALREAVGIIGPVSVAVDSIPWQFYSEGIFADSECKKDPNLLNHAVLVVGYGIDNDEEFWIIKNSYGPDWGEEGYIRLARNAGNMCGVASTPSFPIL